jgi:hypothetical protein
VPECRTNENLPFYISLSPVLKGCKGLTAIEAMYQAGYGVGKVPAGLASACMELAAWNMVRYKGGGKDGARAGY